MQVYQVQHRIEGQAIVRSFVNIDDAKRFALSAYEDGYEPVVINQTNIAEVVDNVSP